MHFVFISNIIAQNRCKVNTKQNDCEVIMATKSLSIRIDDKMLDKLHYVADYEGRSANSQIIVLIRGLIEEYEAKHGEIKTGKR